MRLLSVALALAVSLVMVGSLSAADEKKPHEGKARPQALPGLDVLEGLTLTAEQKAKVEELKKEYGPQFKALDEKREAVLTVDQKKARREAMKEAKEAGKKGKEVREAGRAAVKLTDEQKVKVAAVAKEFSALAQEVRGKAESILTSDQKEVAKTRRAHRRERRSEGN